MKAETVEQYKILKYIKNTFFAETIRTSLINRNHVRLTDMNGDSLIFEYSNGEVTFREAAPECKKKIVEGGPIEVTILSIPNIADAKADVEEYIKRIKKSIQKQSSSDALKRLLNTKFDDKEIVAHFTYKDKETTEEVKAHEKAVTIITLTYDNKACRESEDLSSLCQVVKSIESNEANKEGLKIIVSTDFGKGNRIHHHILVNRKVEINVKEVWENGLSSIEYINEDHYRAAISYIMH